MEGSAQESYLVTEVITAAPQKLQLMLIDAAIRAAEKARRLWREQKDEQACEALIRAQEIVGQILGSLNHEPAPDLVRKVAAVYLFIFRSLMEAGFQRDERKLDDALKVLRAERETWRQVCERLGTARQPDCSASTLAGSPPAPPIPPVRGTSPPPLGRATTPAADGPRAATASGDGLCLEA